MKILSGSTTSSSSSKSASHDVTETIKIQRASAKKLGYTHRLNNNKLIIYYYQVYGYTCMTYYMTYRYLLCGSRHKECIHISDKELDQLAPSYALVCFLKIS